MLTTVVQVFLSCLPKYVKRFPETQVKNRKKYFRHYFAYYFNLWFYKVILSKISFNETERKFSIFFEIYSICLYIPFILQIIRMHDYFDQSSRKLKWTRVLENL